MMKQYCKTFDNNHKNDLKIFEAPDVPWFKVDSRLRLRHCKCHMSRVTIHMLFVCYKIYNFFFYNFFFIKSLSQVLLSTRLPCIENVDISRLSALIMVKLSQQKWEFYWKSTKVNSLKQSNKKKYKKVLKNLDQLLKK